MNGLKAITRILLLAVIALLSSCIDCREEYWLHADGSGRAEMFYQVPVAAASVHGGESGVRELIAAFLNDTPEITTSTCEVVTEEKRIQVKIDITFDSALDLRHIVSGDSLEALPAAASPLAGQVIADIRGRTLEFSRKISPSMALAGSAFLPDSQFVGHHMLYIMHLPTAATESNATRVEDSGRTLVWDFPLAQAIKVPPVTRFKMEIPIPWGLVSAVAIPLSLAAGGFVLLRIRKSRSPIPVGNSQKSLL